MSNIKKVIYNSVLRSDLLSCSSTLRYGGQPVYQSFCPGLLSILVVGIFIAIFVIKFLSVLDLQDIVAFQHIADNVQSADPIDDIMFGMTIEGLSFTQFEKYFQFTINQVILSRINSTQPKTTTQKQIPLRACVIDYWSSMEIDNMDTLFSKRGMSSFFCPTSGFYVSGTSDQDTYAYTQIRLKQCNTSTSSHCLNDTARASYYQNYVNSNQYFAAKLFIKDTIISPTQQTPYSNYLQRDILLSFSTTTGTTGYIKLADYQITTDVNILPWSQQQTDSGYFIQTFQTSTVPSHSRFLYLKLEKSTKKLTVQRQYGKLDDMLSYVGGLFGLIFYCIQFVMMSYNQYRYQLAVSQSLFDYDSSGHKVKEQEMGFLNYMKYSIYDWLSFFGCQPKCWESMKQIHETRQQTNQQIDVRYLMKKMRYLQNVAEILTTQEQRTCLLVTQAPTLQKVKKIRNIAQYNDKQKQASENSLKFIQKIGDFSQMSINIAEDFTKRAGNIQNQNFVNKQIKNNDLSFPKNIEMSQQHITNNSNDLEQNLHLQVFQAVSKLINSNDQMNRKIANKLPLELVRKIKSRVRKRSTGIIEDESFQEIKLDPTQKREVMSRKLKKKS